MKTQKGKIGVGIGKYLRPRFQKEIWRLIKPGGQLILTAPFPVPIVDGEFHHYRFTFHGLNHLFEKQSFEIAENKPVSDLFGVTTTFMVKPWLRFWNVLAKKSRLKIIYSPYNPLIYFFVLLPQMAYLFIWQSGLRIKLLGKLLERFSYGSIGYFSVVRKTKLKAGG